MDCPLIRTVTVWYFSINEKINIKNAKTCFQKCAQVALIQVFLTVGPNNLTLGHLTFVFWKVTKDTKIYVTTSNTTAAATTRIFWCLGHTTCISFEEQTLIFLLCLKCGAQNKRGRDLTTKLGKSKQSAVRWTVWLCPSMLREKRMMKGKCLHNTQKQSNEPCDLLNLPWLKKLKKPKLVTKQLLYQNHCSDCLGWTTRGLKGSQTFGELVVNVCRQTKSMTRSFPVQPVSLTSL